MKHEFLNDGKPLESGPHAGKIGVTIDFEDGGQNQNIYGASKDELFDKVMGMYGNTRARNRELQAERKPGTPEPAPVVQTKLTPDQRLAVVEDLNDPAKAGKAIATLVKEDLGIDLEAQAQRDREAALIESRKRVTEEFVANTPDWVGTKRNATLLRDRVAAVYGIDRATAQNYAEAYNHLKELGVLESAPDSTPQGTSTEPSAPPSQRPSGTGAPPSRLRTSVQPPPAQRETLDEILQLAPSEYERRLRNEPGFADKVNRLYEERNKTA